MPFFIIFILYEILNLLGAFAIIAIDQAQNAAA
jgi:hypothetical protein